MTREVPRWPIRPIAFHGRAIRELPVAERPRERLALRGPAGLTAAELLALVWGSGTRGRSAVDLAADVLARYDGLTGLARATDLELAGLAGIGEARAAQLVAAFELGRRLLADWPAGRWSIRGPRDVADRLDPPDGPARARGAAGRAARHEEPRAARRDGLPGQRQRLARARRRAVSRRRPAQRGERHPRPQPPLGRPDAIARRPAPDRRGPRGRAAARHRACSTTSSSATTPYVSLRDRGVAFDRPAPPAGPSPRGA